MTLALRWIDVAWPMPVLAMQVTVPAGTRLEYKYVILEEQVAAQLEPAWL